MKAHLKILNFNNFKIIEAIELKIMHQFPLEWHYLRTKFHEIIPSGSKVINGNRHIDRLVI
jgi:hypothetical protein